MFHSFIESKIARYIYSRERNILDIEREIYLIFNSMHGGGKGRREGGGREREGDGLHIFYLQLVVFRRQIVVNIFSEKCIYFL